MHLDTLLDGQATAIGQGLRRIVSHVDAAWALAGSVAMVAQLETAGFVSHGRRFGDIDLVVDDLANLPPSLAQDFLCIHLHPNAGSGQILAQFVHPADAVRIDAFRVAGKALSRATLFRFDGRDVRVLSLEDQIAKAAALCMKLARGGTIATKHAKDFELLLNAVPLPKVEEAWIEYRAPSDPATFETAAPLVRSLISDRSDLLITPTFSQDLASVCSRCESKPPYRIAPPDQVFAVLGYV